MIIPIILFILIILAIAMLIMFSVYILLPSINIQEDKSDEGLGCSLCGQDLPLQ